MAQPLSLQGSYSPGKLLKVTGGLKVAKATEKNSCPDGWKIFAPRSITDWQTVYKTVGGTLPASPNAIVDVTRGANGCGGCTGYAMKSGVSQQSSWHTNDGQAWFMRADKFGEPNGDYHANCYLHIYKIESNGVIQFNGLSLC